MSARRAHPAPTPSFHGEYRLIDLGEADPVAVQGFCECVAASVGRGDSPPTVLVATTSTPHASLGFHQSFEGELDRKFLKRRSVPALRRVTGGGLTWHDRSQVFYQAIFPLGGEMPAGPGAFRSFLAPALRMLRRLGIRATLRAPADLVVHHRKISGNAGGEWEGCGILQGDILGQLDVASMAGILRSPHPAFRHLLEQEMEEALTSVAAESRAVPSAVLRRGMAREFLLDRLFRARVGVASSSELREFRHRVRPRHRSNGWLRSSPPTALADPLFRKVRVAGERFVEASEDPECPGAVLLRVRDLGRELLSYRAPPVGEYRGLSDLRRR